MITEDLITVNIDIADNSGNWHRILFVVDTGSSTTILSKKLVDKLGLQVRMTGQKLKLDHGYSLDASHDLFKVTLRLGTRDDGYVSLERPTVIMDSDEFVLGIDTLNLLNYRLANGVCYLIGGLPEGTAPASPTIGAAS